LLHGRRSKLPACARLDGPADGPLLSTRFSRETDADVETVRVVEQFFDAHLGDLALEQIADGGLVLVKEVNELTLAVAALLNLADEGQPVLGYLAVAGFAIFMSFLEIGAVGLQRPR
jgi:hypothetical protein